MDYDALISLVPLEYILRSFYRKFFRRYRIEDLNSSKKKEAAKYFTGKGWKCIEDLVMKYDGFIDKEFIQNEIFSKLKIEKKSQQLILNLLSNQYEWRVRYGALIVIKKATISNEIKSDIIEKVKVMSRDDKNKENRITAHDVLVEKLSEESLDCLLWGIENDSQNEVRMNCLDKISFLGNKNQRVVKTLERTFEIEEKIGNTDVIEKLIEIFGEMKMRSFSDRLIRYLDNDNKILSEKAAIALLKICDDNALYPIREKCLIVRDVLYRKRIIENGFRHKKGSRKAIEILRWYSRIYPDDDSIVVPVLEKIYDQGGEKP